jgi:hypothetical protein
MSFRKVTSTLAVGSMIALFAVSLGAGGAAAASNREHSAAIEHNWNRPLYIYAMGKLVATNLLRRNT